MAIHLSQSEAVSSLAHSRLHSKPPSESLNLLCPLQAAHRGPLVSPGHGDAWPASIKPPHGRSSPEWPYVTMASLFFPPCCSLVAIMGGASPIFLSSRYCRQRFVW